MGENRSKDWTIGEAYEDLGYSFEEVKVKIDYWG